MMRRNCSIAAYALTALALAAPVPASNAATTAPSSGKEPILWGTHRQGFVYHIAVSADGRRAATLGEDRKLAIWDTATWTRLRDIVVGEEHFSVELSPDGSLAALPLSFGPRVTKDQMPQEGEIFIYSTSDGKLAKKLVGFPTSPYPFVGGMAFSKDGRRLLAVSPDLATTVWRIASGRPPARTPGVPSGTLRRDELEVAADWKSALAKDGGALEVYDLAAKKLVRRYEPLTETRRPDARLYGPGVGRAFTEKVKELRGCARSADGGLLASSSYHNVWLQRSADGEVLRAAAWDSRQAFRFTVDGQWLLMGGGDGKLYRWPIDGAR